MARRLPLVLALLPLVLALLPALRPLRLPRPLPAEFVPLSAELEVPS